jgi:hypothetical protein
MIVRKTWDFETPIWRKLQIDIDADSDKIVAFDLTDKVNDASHVGPSLE